MAINLWRLSHDYCHLNNETWYSPTYCHSILFHAEKYLYSVYVWMSGNVPRECPAPVSSTAPYQVSCPVKLNKWTCGDTSEWWPVLSSGQSLSYKPSSPHHITMDIIGGEWRPDLQSGELKLSLTELVAASVSGEPGSLEETARLILSTATSASSSVSVNYLIPLLLLASQSALACLASSLGAPPGQYLKET